MRLWPLAPFRVEFTDRDGRTWARGCNSYPEANDAAMTAAETHRGCEVFIQRRRNLIIYDHIVRRRVDPDAPPPARKVSPP